MRIYEYNTITHARLSQQSVDYRNTKVTQHARNVPVNACGLIQTALTIDVMFMHGVHRTCTEMTAVKGSGTVAPPAM